MTEKKKQKKSDFLNRLWRKIRYPLMNARITKAIVVSLMANYLRLVYWTNPRLEGSDDPQNAHDAYNPFIITFWHGRHIMAMFSRSADAEINARVGEKLGLETVRGSGGRTKHQNTDKGGARALLTLKRALQEGKTAAMIADIAHGKAREAGKGIILLAKISGRPIVPYIYSFSHVKILEKTWDKTVIPLPFGHSIFLMGDAFYVPEDADDDLMEQKRIELSDIMNRLTDEAEKRLKERK